ncbi:hypothetical protein [Fructobacillus ficulneus]|uniref:Uncharacterized protein n=1 Tax=Fructobacillus ficulneus TaxID=157463 RepID=A0A0K8MIY0_9LACO|nr:hypothetical protein [Fructobacillus ficulneus]GAO99844.1 hypothetical protein FFIC_241190 [Fructobacillus ficulneus]
MKKVYLVTGEETGDDWGDSLWVEGVFSSPDNASEYINQNKDKPMEFSVTAMTVDDTRENDELLYPFASYFE